MAGERWHVHAVQLPAGDQAEDAWIVDGRTTSEPQADCDDLPGGWMLPGLVDAHAHLSHIPEAECLRRLQEPP